MEDLLYEVESVRRFAGLRLTGALPDETTILKFRHLLEEHGLGEGLFAEINAHLASLGHSARKGTIMDATIIEAPSSTKNARRERDPEMHQAKKGNQWHFGMKAHIGWTPSRVWRTAWRRRRRTSPTWRRRMRCCTATRRRRGATPATRGWRSARRTRVRTWTGGQRCGPASAACWTSRAGGGGGEAQGVGAGEGGASVPVRQAALRLREGALRGLAKNRQRIALLLGFANLMIAGRYATG